MTVNHTLVLLGAFVGVAAVLDLRARRIPNALTLPGLVVGLIVSGLAGWAHLGAAFVAVGIAFAVLIPLFALRVVGGGDAKLLIAVAAYMDPQRFFITLLLTAVAGGCLALLMAVRQGIILPALLNTGGTLKYVFTMGRSGSRPVLHAPGAMTIPYGVAIAIGAITGGLL